MSFINVNKKGDLKYYVIIYFLYEIYIFQTDQLFASPDDTALINFSKYCGIKTQSEGNNIEITFKDYQEKYEILHYFEFNSARRRSTVILKDKNNQILLFCKGADSELIRLLKIPIDKDSQEEL